MSQDMAAVVEQLRLMRDSMLTTLQSELAYQAANGPKPSYSLDGQNFSWNEWLSGMLENIGKLNKQIAELSWVAGPVMSRWAS